MEVYYLESDHLKFYWLFDHAQHLPVDTIVKARVLTVLPQLDAAMLDLGQGRRGFLKNQHIPAKFSQESGWRYFSKSQPIIDKIQSGDCLLVQVRHLPRGDKQYQVTADVSLTGLFWAYRPLSRQPLRGKQDAIKGHKPLPPEIYNRLGTSLIGGAWVLRSIARLPVVQRQEGYLACLERELEELKGGWAKLARSLVSSHVIQVLWEELDWFSPIRTLLNNRCLSHKPTLWVSSELKMQLNRYSMLQEVLTVETLELSHWLDMEKRLHLKESLTLSGSLSVSAGGRGSGNIRFEQREALTTVDVNSGNLSGQGQSDPNRYKLLINERALEVVQHQLGLRNVRGMVIVDWISVSPNKWLEFKKRVEALKSNDPWVRSITHLDDQCLTLVERTSLGETLMSSSYDLCDYCQGSGRLRSKVYYARKLLSKLELILEQPCAVFKKVYQCYLVQLSQDVFEIINMYYENELASLVKSHRVRLNWEPHGRHRAEFQIKPVEPLA